MSDPSDDTIELRTEPRDERAEEHDPRRRPRKPWIKGVIAAVVLAVFGTGTWYAYSIGMRTGSEGAAPLIRADQRPSKVKPDDPGGMAVPHQDKTIFDRVKPTDEHKKVEQLLPPPEEPVARPKKPQQQAAAPTPAPAAPTTPSAAPAAPPTPAPTVTPAPTPAPEAKAPAADAKTPPPAETKAAPPPEPPTAAQLAAPPPLATTPTPAPQAAPKPAEAPKAVTPPAPAAAAPAKGGAYKVQIASVPSQEQAEKEWSKAKAANSDLLGGLTMSIQKADLGAKGIYYRVQAGPLADDTAAKALCASLQPRKIGCLVVRP